MHELRPGVLFLPRCRLPRIRPRAVQDEGAGRQEPKENRATDSGCLAGRFRPGIHQRIDFAQRLRR